MSPVTVPQAQILNDFRRQLDDIRGAAATLVEVLSDEQLNWKPGPDRWSIAECLEHLTVTAELYFAALDDVMARGRAEGKAGREQAPFSFSHFERWFLRSLEPPVRMKVRAPRTFVPGSGLDARDVYQRFLAAQDGLEQRIRTAEGLDLRRIRVASPLSRLLRFRLGFALAYLLAHERRHLWQAEQVRREAGFPAR